MGDCRWRKRVEMWFDREFPDPESVARHLAECAACAAHVAWLQQVRGSAAVLAAHPGISDPQFPAFMGPIRERIEVPVSRRKRLWAFASVAAAALVVAAATFLVVAGRPGHASATVIESATTEIEGAKVDVYSSDNGTATVWVNIGGGDVL